MTDNESNIGNITTRIRKIDVEALIKQQSLKERPIDKKVIDVTTDSEIIRTMVEKHRKSNGIIIFEVGFGGKFCINLGNNDLSVGIDPMNDSTNTLSAKGLESGQGSERVFLNSFVRDLPEGVYPDYVIVVAPSPESYIDVFDELVEKTKGDTKFAVFIENQSQQAVDGASLEMVTEIKDRLMKKRSDTDVVDLESSFDDYLEEIGLRNGGVLKTDPWNTSGEWMVVLGKGLKENY